MQKLSVREKPRTERVGRVPKRRRRSALVLIGAAAFVLFSAWLLAGWGGPSTAQVVSDLGSLVFGVLAIGCMAIAARRSEGRQRRAWTALTVGVVCWTGG